MKMITLRDWDNDVAGYRLGDYQLCKHYYYGNLYSWELKHINCYNTRNIILIQRSTVLGQIKQDLDAMYTIPVISCKEGKNLLKLLME